MTIVLDTSVRLVPLGKRRHRLRFTPQRSSGAVVIHTVRPAAEWIGNVLKIDAGTPRLYLDPAVIGRYHRHRRQLRTEAVAAYYAPVRQQVPVRPPDPEAPRLWIDQVPLRFTVDVPSLAVLVHTAIGRTRYVGMAYDIATATATGVQLQLHPDFVDRFGAEIEAITEAAGHLWTAAAAGDRL